MLTKEALKARKPKPVARLIEAWGEEVLFRPIGAKDRLAVYDLFQKASGPVDQARVCYAIVAMSAVEENGTRLFASGDEVGDFEDEVVNQLVAAAMEVNGFGGNAIEDEAKN